MSILGKIFSKIFPSGQTPATGPGMPPTTAPTTPTESPVPMPPPLASGVPAQQDRPVHKPPVDVEVVLSRMAEQTPEKLNWKTSIVDLMKLLQLDSSLSARKALAFELGYAGPMGDVGDSAAMNIWLHRQVMNKLAANGGVVPPELRD